MSTFGQAATALRQAAADIERQSTNAVAEATRQLTALVLAGQGRAGASSGRLRGVGQHGARIGAKGTVNNGVGLVRATGPAHLLDHPTGPHTITARRARVLLTPAGPRRSVQHPGSRGKFYFEDAVEMFEPRLAGVFAAAVGQAIGDL